MSEPAAPLRLELDVARERAVARLRLAGAMGLLAGSVGIVLGEPGTLEWLCVGLGALVAVGWIVAFGRARRRVEDRERHHLDIATSGFTITEGGETRQVSWDEVSGVDVDEDRLEVVVERMGEAAVRLAPVWGRLGLHELAATLTRYRDHGARTPEDD